MKKSLNIALVVVIGVSLLLGLEMHSNYTIHLEQGFHVWAQADYDKFINCMIAAVVAAAVRFGW